MGRIELSAEVAGVPEGLGEKLEGILEHCRLTEGAAPVACDVRIVGDEAIRSINARFRNIDRATDVLSFPSVSYPQGKTARDCPKRLKREYDPEMGACMIGDVVISLETAARQADEYGHGIERELCYLMAHSVFHLFGYDHMTDGDKRVMREREKRVMRLAGLAGKDEND